ncbi:hypothetical protein HAX54_012183, partial [Datura stramonium]|nr:hypothetical protein [Datura stramonium]
LDDGSSPVPSRSGSPSLWVTEVLIDHQISDGPSQQPSLRTKFQAILFKEGRRTNRSS